MEGMVAGGIAIPLGLPVAGTSYQTFYGPCVFRCLQDDDAPGDFRCLQDDDAPGDFRSLQDDDALVDFECPLQDADRPVEECRERATKVAFRAKSEGEQPTQAMPTIFEDQELVAEIIVPRSDRSVAELSGDFKSLSEEMQAHSRRVDLLDDQLWDVQQQLTDELRQRYSDLDKQLSDMASVVRTSVMGQDTRWQTGRQPHDGQETDARLDAHDTQLGSLQALFESWEERMQHVRAKVDKQEEWESKVEAVQQTMQEESSQATAQRRDLEALIERVEQQERRAEALQTSHERCSADSRGLLEELRTSVQESIGRLSSAVQRLEERLERGHRTIGATVEDVASLRCDVVAGRECSQVANDELVGKQETLEALILREVEGVSSSVAAKHARLEQDLERAADFLREGLSRVSDQSEKTSQMVQVMLRDCEAMRAEIAELKRSDSVQRDLDNIRGEIAGLKSCDGMQLDIDGLKSEVSKLRSHDAKSDVAALRETLSGEVDALRRDVSSLKSLECIFGELEALRGDHVTLKSLEGQVSGELAALRRDVAALRHQEQAATDEIKTVKGSIAELQTRADALSELPALKQDITLLNNQGSRLSELESVKKDMEYFSQWACAHHDLDSIRSELAEFKAHRGTGPNLEGIRSDLAELKACMSTQSDLDGLRRDLHELKSRDGADGLKSDVSGLSSQETIRPHIINIIKSEVAELQSPFSSELEALRREVVALKSSDGENGLSGELEALRGDVVALKHQEGGTLAELHVVKGSLAELRVREMAALMEDVAALNGQVDVASDLEGVKSDIKELKDLRALVVDFEALRGEVSAMKDSGGAMQACAGDELVAIRRTMAELKQCGDASSEIEAIKDDVAALKAQSKALTELADIKDDVIVLKSQGGALNELEGATDLLREGLARVKDQSESTLQMVRGSLDDLAGLKSDVERLSRQACAAPRGLEGIKEDIAEIRC